MGSGDRKGRKGTGRGESAAGKGIGEKFLVINKKKKKEKQQQEFLLNNSCLLIMADPVCDSEPEILQRHFWSRQPLADINIQFKQQG